MRNPPSQHLSAAEGLEATKDCWMTAAESRRKTAGANLQILLHSVKNNGAFHSEGRSDPGLSLKSGSTLLKRAKQWLRTDRGGVLSQCVLMFRTFAVAVLAKVDSIGKWKRTNLSVCIEWTCHPVRACT